MTISNLQPFSIIFDSIEIQCMVDKHIPINFGLLIQAYLLEDDDLVLVKHTQNVDNLMAAQSCNGSKLCVIDTSLS